jgi:hypothetical protein
VSDIAPHPTPEVHAIKEALVLQLMEVMGITHPNRLTRTLFSFLNPPAKRMATIAVELDRNIAQDGWNSAANHFLTYFVTDVNVLGGNEIPTDGPLMVVCNHPAAYDVAILAAQIRREDLKILGSDIPIIQMLPNVAEHAIPVPYNIPSRLMTVRSTIRQLQKGKAVLLFPRGNVEPDPAVSPGADQSLAGWSPSIELFLRRVPETVSVVAIASGMLSAKWYKSPIINLWRKYEQRQKVAEIFQISTQLLTGMKPDVNPMITFSAPLTVNDLGGAESPEGTLLAGLTDQAKELLQLHPHIDTTDSSHTPLLAGKPGQTTLG